jgi:hypothetical protein
MVEEAQGMERSMLDGVTALGEAYHRSTVLTPLIHPALRAQLWPIAR